MNNLLLSCLPQSTAVYLVDTVYGLRLSTAVYPVDCRHNTPQWTNLHTPWIPQAGPSAVTGAAGVRKHAKVGENWRNFQILRSRSAHECFYT